MHIFSKHANAYDVLCQHSTECSRHRPFVLFATFDVLNTCWMRVGEEIKLYNSHVVQMNTAVHESL
jgi:hypothetical protein